MTWIRALRVRQWSKNLLVFVPLVFALKADDPSSLLAATFFFAAYCMASSGAYLINDVRDHDLDRLHPLKRNRPVASGAIAPAAAVSVALVLFAASMLLAWLAVRPQAGWILFAYIGLQILYNAGLRGIPGADVVTVGLGFVLRAVGGAVAIGVIFSEWLVLATFFGSARLVLGKRQSELASAKTGLRAAWEKLSDRRLELAGALTSATLLLIYTFYCFESRTAASIGPSWRNFPPLFLTVPVVYYGVMRYELIAGRTETAEPELLLLRDRPLLLSVVLWLILAATALYGRRFF